MRFSVNFKDLPRVPWTVFIKNKNDTVNSKHLSKGSYKFWIVLFNLPKSELFWMPGADMVAKRMTSFVCAPFLPYFTLIRHLAMILHFIA